MDRLVACRPSQAGSLTSVASPRYGDVVQKPSVDLREVENFVDRHAVLKRLSEMEDALGIGDRQLEAERFGIEPLSYPSPHRPKRLISSERSAFWSASLNAADRHRFADAFHLRRQCRIGCGNFSKVNAELFDAIIDLGSKLAGVSRVMSLRISSSV